jgi:hypothetical protein
MSTCRNAGFQIDRAEPVLQHCRLAGKLLADGSSLLGICRVLLNHLVDLLQADIDLRYPVGQLVAGCGNFAQLLARNS